MRENTICRPWYHSDESCSIVTRGFESDEETLHLEEVFAFFVIQNREAEFTQGTCDATDLHKTVQSLDVR